MTTRDLIRALEDDIEEIEAAVRDYRGGRISAYNLSPSNSATSSLIRDRGHC